MRQRKVYVLFVVLLYFSSVLFSSNVFAVEHGWLDWGGKKNVVLDKVWKINFNQPVLLDSIHSESVYVKDASGQRVDVTPIWDSDNMQILVYPPEGGYQPESTYDLFISGQIKSSDGKLFKKPLKMRFRTGSSWEGEQTKFEPRPDSANEAVLSENVIVIDEKTANSLTDIDAENDRLIFSGHPDMVASMEEGQIITIPPSKDYPFGLAKQVESIQSHENKTIVMTSEPAFEDVVASLDFSQEFPITAENVKINEAAFVSPEQSDPGKRVFTAQNILDKITVENAKNGDIIIRLKEVDVFQVGPNKAKLNGSLTLEKPRISADYDFNIFQGGLNSAYVFFTAGQKADLTFKLPKTTYENNYELKLADIFVPVPGVPLAGATIEVVLVQKINGSIEIDFRASESFNVTAGVSYKNGHIEPLGEIKSHAGIDVLKIDGEINYNIGVKLGIYMSVMQLKLAGVEATGGYNLYQRGYMGDPVSPCYNINHHLYATAGYTLNVVNQSGNLLNWQQPLGSFEYCKAISSIQANPNPAQLEPGQQQQLSVIANNQDGSTQTLTEYLTFSSSDSNVASVNSSGLITAARSAKEGDTATIEVKYNNKQSTNVTVNIMAPDPTHQEALLKSLSIEEGELSPAFSPSEKAYASEVDSSVKEVTLTAIAEHDGHKVYVFGNELTTGKKKVPLAEGQSNTVILIEVFNPASDSYVAYTLTIKKKGNNEGPGADIEPNNTMEQAVLIQEGQEIRGELNMEEDLEGLYDGTDWYKLIIPEDGSIEITANGHYSYVYPHLLIVGFFSRYGTSGVGLYLEDGETATFKVDGLRAGTYYINVNHWVPSSYTFKYTFTPIENNDAEPNDTRNDAQLLPPTGEVSGYIGYANGQENLDEFDWYKLEIPEDGVIKLNISNDYSYRSVPIISHIIDENGAYLYMATHYDFKKDLDIYESEIKKGTYYIIIEQSDIRKTDLHSGSKYTITSSFTADKPN